VDGAAPVWSDDGTALATAGGDTRYSTTRAHDSYTLAVRNEHVLALGDSDVLRPMNHNRADNNQLLGGTLAFRTDGPRDPYTPVEPETGMERSRPTPPNARQAPPTEPGA